jgi:diguanylate cyclase (GGDEF)-like protein
MSLNLIERIRTTENLPPLPMVALEVLQFSKGGAGSAQDLARIVSRDPAMTARVLRLVNSPLFGVTATITSVQQAISLLGLRCVTVTILSLALVGAVKDQVAEGLDLDAFWRRSLATAAAAKLLAKAVAPRVSDDAFVAGLICDLGVLGAARCAPEEYGPVLKEAADSRRALEAVEQERLGLTHAELGREMLRAWKLPDVLCDAVGTHHGEGLAGLAPDARLLGSIVHAGASIGALFNRDLPATELERVRAECVSSVGVSPEAMESILGNVEAQLLEAAKFIGVPVGKTIGYEQLQSEAATALARLSLEAEADRATAARREAEMRLENQRLQADNRAVQHAAMTDALTKVANRGAFDRQLDDELRRVQAQRGAGRALPSNSPPPGTPHLGLIIIDIDRFKGFNDTYGHQAGDEVLRRVAARIAVAPNQFGFVARYGGEEFAVIVPGATRADTLALAEKIRLGVEQTPLGIAGQRLSVTASLGVACLEDFQVCPRAEELIALADRFLYEAKHQGRNRTVASTTSRTARKAA